MGIYPYSTISQLYNIFQVQKNKTNHLRVTATLRRPQISDTQPQNRGGGIKNQQEHHIIFTKYEADHPMAILEYNSSSGMLII